MLRNNTLRIYHLTVTSNPHSDVKPRRGGKVSNNAEEFDNSDDVLASEKYDAKHKQGSTVKLQNNSLEFANSRDELDIARRFNKHGTKSYHKYKNNLNNNKVNHMKHHIPRNKPYIKEPVVSTSRTFHSSDNLFSRFPVNKSLLIDARKKFNNDIYQTLRMFMPDEFNPLDLMEHSKTHPYNAHNHKVETSSTTSKRTTEQQSKPVSSYKSLESFRERNKDEHNMLSLGDKYADYSPSIRLSILNKEIAHLRRKLNEESDGDEGNMISASRQQLLAKITNKREKVRSKSSKKDVNIICKKLKLKRLPIYNRAGSMDESSNIAKYKHQRRNKKHFMIGGKGTMRMPAGSIKSNLSLLKTSRRTNPLLTPNIDDIFERKITELKNKLKYIKERNRPPLIKHDIYTRNNFKIARRYRKKKIGKAVKLKPDVVLKLMIKCLDIILQQYPPLTIYLHANSTS